MRGALVVAEIAFACVLLVGAGLLIRSFLRVLDVDLGFRPERAAAMRVDPGSADTPRAEQLNRLLERSAAARAQHSGRGGGGDQGRAAAGREPQLGHGSEGRGNTRPASIRTRSCAWSVTAIFARWEFRCARAAISPSVRSRHGPCC